MSAYLFQSSASAICPHGGQVSVNSTNTRVKADGQFVTTRGDTFLISGCSFTTPAGSPLPCVQVQWLVPATRVKVAGQFVILQSSSGLCQSAAQTPQGPPNIISTQTRVKAT